MFWILAVALFQKPVPESLVLRPTDQRGVASGDRHAVARVLGGGADVDNPVGRRIRLRALGAQAIAGRRFWVPNPEIAFLRLSDFS